MSCVTNLIVTWHISENRDQLKLINTYFYDTNESIRLGLLHINGSNCFGGDKNLEHNIAIGAFNYLNLDLFIQYLKTLSWNRPESVRLHICEQEDEGFWIRDL